MKVTLAQLNYHIGNFEENSRKIIQVIEEGKNKGVDLVVFAELAICGYPPRDFLEFHDFIELCEEYIQIIATHCTGIAAIVGGPSRNHAPKGKKLCNSAFFLAEGEIKTTYHKQLLPNYDVFDEYRYFEQGPAQSCINYMGRKIALTICEDIWNIEGAYLYRTSPLDKLIEENPDFIINIAASPFSFKQVENRNLVLDWNIRQYKKPILYVNHVGAQTELIFDGGSCVRNDENHCLNNLPAFEEGVIEVDTASWMQADAYPALKKYERIDKALTLGVKDYFRKLKFREATLGLSGGIDSALTLVIAVQALGRDNVKPILLPSHFSSKHSIDDSIALCKNLGCKYHLIEIKDIFHEFDEKLKPLFGDRPFDIAEENIQSRIRGTLLMAYANKFGAILLNTSNKSELAVGYGTLYGDMAGGLSVLGDLYKTEVFELSRFYNREKEVIPKHIISKPPSAELRPDQKDSDSLPDYAILDQILYHYLEEMQSPSDLIEQGFEAALVKKVLRLVNINEYKRHQTPPILRISQKAFGMGRRMPIVGRYLA
jgi:NAD+ synthase (glutamine-hydrolysing)